MKSQNQQVLDWLKKGSITALEALLTLGIGRLAARINDLRCQGISIATTMVRQGGKRFAVYSMGAV